MKKNKLFVVRKYIFAKDIREVITKEKTQLPEDIWIEEKWRENNMQNPNKDVGF